MAAPTIVGAYSDARNAGSAASVTVPNVQPNDWLVAGYGVIYDPGTLSMGGSGAGTWLPIGSQVGSPNSPNYQNYCLQSFYKAATGSGSYTVAGGNAANEQVLGVLHLRGCDSIDGTPYQAAITQNSSNRNVDAGPVSPTATDSLLVGFFGLVHFGSLQSWTPPAGMTEQVDKSSPNYFNTMECATQLLTASGSTGVKTAVSSMTGSVYGEASKLFAIKGAGAAPSGVEPGRFLMTI